MSALGQKRTCAVQNFMSTKCQKRTLPSPSVHVGIDCEFRDSGPPATFYFGRLCRTTHAFALHSEYFEGRYFLGICNSDPTTFRLQSILAPKVSSATVGRNSNESCGLSFPCIRVLDGHP